MATKQEKKKPGARSSSSAHKAGIVRTHARLTEKRLRRIIKVNGLGFAKSYAEERGQAPILRKIEASGFVASVEAARERRRKAREAKRAG